LVESGLNVGPGDAGFVQSLFQHPAGIVQKFVAGVPVCPDQFRATT
jgi:hypothetical protein